MKPRHFLAAAFATAALALADSPASSADKWQSAPSSDRLLMELKSLTDNSEHDQQARRNVVPNLRALIARYEWPWSRLLMSDTFADGDHARNPAWIVRSGRFEVDHDRRLVSTQELPRSAQASPSAQSQGNLGQQLLGNLLEQMTQPQQQQQRGQRQAEPDRSEISTPVKMTNAFDLRVTLQSLSNDGRIEFGPYLAGEEHQGYRLVYLPNGTPPLALVRYSASGSGVVQAADQAIRPPGQGSEQNIQWLRSEGGEMSVFLNGEAVIRARDNAFTKGFEGLLISNLAGTHAIREVTLHGAR